MFLKPDHSGPARVSNLELRNVSVLFREGPELFVLIHVDLLE